MTNKPFSDISRGKTMTQKEEISALEKIKKDTKYLAIGLFCVLLIGAMLLFFGIISCIAYQNMKDPTHFSDPNMKYSDLKNDSFIWTRGEINSEMTVWTYLIVFGGGLLAGGYVLTFVFPSKKDFHKLGCSVQEFREIRDIKYCPDCGLKLSKLK